MEDTPGGVFIGSQRDLGILDRKIVWREGPFFNTNGDEDTFRFTIEELTRVRVRMDKITGKSTGGIALFDVPPENPALGRDSYFTSFGQRSATVSKILDPGEYMVDINLYSGEGVGYRLTISELKLPGRKANEDDQPSRNSPIMLHDVLDRTPSEDAMTHVSSAINSLGTGYGETLDRILTSTSLA